ncbi:MAG TPA: hypothetical protein VNM69_06635 [Bacillus sp. (in: firmicutes)]|nr:hypothetical protein [Bacillus sp. (in: firmicutes)]
MINNIEIDYYSLDKSIKLSFQQSLYITVNELMGVHGVYADKVNDEFFHLVISDMEKKSYIYKQKWTREILFSINRDLLESFIDNKIQKVKKYYL